MVRLVAALALVALQPACDGAAGGGSGPPADPCPAGRAEDGPDRCRSLRPELLTHPQAAGSAATARLLEDGDTLDVVAGFQGLWMVVLGFRTELALEGEVVVRALVEPVRGAPAIRDFGAPKRLHDGADGHGYVFELYVVLDPVDAFTGVEARVGVELSAPGGGRLGASYRRVLLGGTPAGAGPPPPKDG